MHPAQYPTISSLIATTAVSQPSASTGRLGSYAFGALQVANSAYWAMEKTQDGSWGVSSLFSKSVLSGIVDGALRDQLVTGKDHVFVKTVQIPTADGQPRGVVTAFPSQIDSERSLSAKDLLIGKVTSAANPAALGSAIYYGTSIATYPSSALGGWLSSSSSTYVATAGRSLSWPGEVLPGLGNVVTGLVTTIATQSTGRAVGEKIGTYIEPIVRPVAKVLHSIEGFEPVSASEVNPCWDGTREESAAKTGVFNVGFLGVKAAEVGISAVSNPYAFGWGMAIGAGKSLLKVVASDSPLASAKTGTENEWTAYQDGHNSRLGFLAHKSINVGIALPLAANSFIAGLKGTEMGEFIGDQVISAVSSFFGWK